MTSPLEQLYADTRALDLELLTALLEPYVWIDRDTADIRFRPAWASLKGPQKVLTFLLAKKAKVLLNRAAEDSEPESPSGIEQATGIPGATLRKTLSRLFDSRLVDKRDSAYFVPNYSLEAVSQTLSRDGS